MEKPRNRALSSGRKSWALRGLIAAIAAAPAIAYLSWTPASWWSRSGFLAYPGTYQRLADNHYRLCRPWPQSGLHINPLNPLAVRAGWTLGKQDANFAVLLPRTAHVTAIYCGAAIAPQAPAECTNAHCSESIRAQVDDGVYSGGRGVIFNIRNLTARADQRTDFQFWVSWRQD